MSHTLIEKFSNSTHGEVSVTQPIFQKDYSVLKLKQIFRQSIAATKFAGEFSLRQKKVSLNFKI